jgi:hypothetical protein
VFESEDAEYFGRGLKIAGVITYAHKYYSKGKFDDNFKKYIESVIDQRLEIALQDKLPRYLNTYELVSLKLLSISLNKEQSKYNG